MPTHFTVEVDWTHNGTWSDETARVEQVRIRSGFERAGASVAAVGRCTLTLRNHDRRYSPGNADGPLYGQLLPRRRVRVRATDGVHTWTLFWGYIERIVPEAGAQGRGLCEIACVDGLDLLARQRIGVAYTDGKPVTQAVAELVGAVYTPPATAYQDNGDTLTHYGRAWQPERTTALDALRDVCRAVYGRFFLARDGTATYWARDNLQNPAAPIVLHLDPSTPLTGLDVQMSVEDVINLAQVTVFPVETVGAPATLWQAHTVLRLAPGQTRVLHALFRDENGERVAATDIQPLQPHTDYAVCDRRDGHGYDYTTDPAFAIQMDVEATRAALTLTNTATGPLYVTLLQVRGRPIRTYDPITLEATDIGSQSAYERRSASLVLAMQSDALFAQSYADYLIHRHSVPTLAAHRVDVRGREILGGVNVFSVGLMAKVQISDPQSGLETAAHRVYALEYTLEASGWRVIWWLERADPQPYWLLEQTGYGELDSATYLGF